jgi:Flp pilus assembly protein TadD
MLASPLGVFSHPEIQSQIDILGAQLLQHPGDPALLMQRADLYRRHGDFDSAQQDLTAAGLAEPVPAELPFYEGRLQLDSGQPAAAEQSFSRYLAAIPLHAKAYVLRAEARSAQGSMEQAAQDYGQAIELSQAPAPELYRLAASCLVQAGDSHWPAAIKVLGSGLERYPREGSLLGLAVDIALAQGDPKGAGLQISRLPRAVLRLPQWQARTNLAATLSNVDPEIRNEGLHVARERLLARTAD